MKVIEAILILAPAAFADESCPVDDGTCLLQLRGKADDLRVSGGQHVSHDVAFWKKRMQFLNLGRSSQSEPSWPPCTGCPQGATICASPDGGPDRWMCRADDDSAAQCAYRCNNGTETETGGSFPDAQPSGTGAGSGSGGLTISSVNTHQMENSGGSGSDGFTITSFTTGEEPEQATPEPEDMPECPGSSEHLQITAENTCSASGVLMEAGDGTHLEDYFWDNVRIREVKYLADGELLATRNEMSAFSFAKKPAGDSSAHVVRVLVRDVGNFVKVCERAVFVEDVSPPTWMSAPPDHSTETMGMHGAHTLRFTEWEDCHRDAQELFQWYEGTRSWDPVAVDNCQDIDGESPTVYKEIYRVDYNSGADGALLYSSNPNNQPTNPVSDYLGEQVLKLKWYAVDASGLLGATHSIRVHLADDVAPTADDVICPAKFHTTILHDQTTAAISFDIPKVIGDNCPPAAGTNFYPAAQEVERYSPDGSFPNLENNFDENNHLVSHTGHFQPGVYEVFYILRDAKGNIYPHECSVLIEVEQYASPVHLECPDEVPASIVGKKNYVPVSWQEPNSNDGTAHQDNNPVTVSYLPEGIVPGMAFPWGQTTVTVVATGTGSVADEAHNRAECTFVVDVKDERPPELNGKKYHCRTLDTGAKSPGAAPYRMCKASKRLNYHEHNPGYLDTGAYTIESVDELTPQPCCDSETVDGNILQHYCAFESELISYCEEGPGPSTSLVAQAASTSASVHPAAPQGVAPAATTLRIDPVA